MARIEKTVFIERLNKHATIPQYANPNDAASDLALCEDLEIKPNETKVVGLGIKIAIPEGYEIQIRPRSGLSAKTHLRIPNSPATIDSNYRDELKVILHNIGTETLQFKQGDRIAQMVLNEAPKAVFEKTEDITKIGGNNRGGGFGSSKLNVKDLKKN